MGPAEEGGAKAVAEGKGLAEETAGGALAELARSEGNWAREQHRGEGRRGVRRH
jgi:hypothetical protein